MNPAEYDERSAIASEFANGITAKGIRGMDADADNISSFNVQWVQGLESFINQAGIAKTRGCRGRQNVQPAGRDDSRTKRDFARIDEMNTHSIAPSSGGLRQAGSGNAPGIVCFNFPGLGI
jgi:hypothetical protein